MVRERETKDSKIEEMFFKDSGEQDWAQEEGTTSILLSQMVM